MPKVSIIIPFSNVESYIDECLKSVVNQTLNDIEIILINDASKDNSLNIVENYKKQDKRIKLINLKDQQGQGYARNRGIEVATGEYIGFVDSDDFIAANMFEYLYNKAKQDDTDITMCFAREYDDINSKYIESDYYSLLPLKDFYYKVFSAEETKEKVLDINVALWNKIYKKEYLDKINEKFTEGYIYEDLPFFFGTYLPANKINIVEEYLYNYRINRKNSTMQQFNNKILDRLPMVSLTYNKMKNCSYLNDYKKQIQGWVINDLFHRYTLLKENCHQEYFSFMKELFQNLDIENLNDDYWNSVYHFQGYLLVISNSYEDFRNKVFLEYLDIHKVENRLRSEMINQTQLDSRFDKVYIDISKNYKYTEKIVENLKNALTEQISGVYTSIENEKNQNNEQISNLYANIDEQKKTIKEDIPNLYANIDEQKKAIKEDISNIYSNIEEQKSAINEDIFNLYDNMVQIGKNIETSKDEVKTEITNNIKEVTHKLYEDTKDLSYVVNNNYEELKQNNENTMSYVNQKVEEIENSNKNIQNNLSSQLERIQNDFDYRIIEISKKHKTELEKANEELKEVKSKYSIEKERYEKMYQALEENFRKELKQKQEQFEEEMNQMKKLLKDLEIDLREEMKSPIKKFIEKRKKKQEK